MTSSTPSTPYVIFCDSGSRNKQTGNLDAWVCVVDNDNMDLLELYHNPIALDQKTEVKDLPVGQRRVAIVRFEKNGEYQNNSGELVGLVLALRIALYKLNTEKFTSAIEIRCDSKLIVDSWSRGRVRKKTADDMDKEKLKMLHECVRLRLHFEKQGGKVCWTPGGKNNADLGAHRDKSAKRKDISESTVPSSKRMK